MAWVVLYRIADAVQGVWDSAPNQPGNLREFDTEDEAAEFAEQSLPPDANYLLVETTEI